MNATAKSSQEVIVYRKEKAKRYLQKHPSSEVVVIRCFITDLLHSVHQLLRLPRDLKGRGWQAVVQVFELGGIVDGGALGISFQEPGPAVGKSAHDRFRSVSKGLVPGFVDGCVGG